MTTQELEKPVEATNIPEGVDPRQVFSIEEFQLAIPVELEAETELKKHKGLTPLPGDMDIERIKTYVDGREARIWENGVVVMEIYLPSNYQPQNVIWTMNGEVAIIEFGSQTMLDRTVEQHTKTIAAKQEETRKKLAENLDINC